jgi:D-glycero-alpha-D-manno-heptose-7-phosphate kinase
VDLAGGTLDIHPLYLFLKNGGLTVNLAVPFYANVHLKRRRDKSIHLNLPDLPDETRQQRFKKWQDMDFTGPGGLVQRAVAFFEPEMGLEVTASLNLPPGTGLGASSTLLMALMHGLNRMTGARLPSPRIIDFGADLEAQHILIPTGKQDYFPAVYGGANALHFGVHGIRREPLKLSAAFKTSLAMSGLLVSTGASRFSGTNNWNMLKRTIDRVEHTPQKLEKIYRCAELMREAILEEDLKKMARALENEWQVRRTLAAGVSTPKIDKLHTAARKAGAWGGKILGAGGGGCYFCLAPPAKVAEVRRALEGQGATSLPFSVAMQGARQRMKVMM